MSWVAVAIGGGAALGLFGSQDASRRQQNSANDARNLTDAQFQSNKRMLQPWVDSGKSANSRLSYLLGTAPTQQQQTGPDWDSYLKLYPDVAASATYGSDPAAHYEQYGKKEGRRVPMFGDTSSGSPQMGAGMPQLGGTLQMSGGTISTPESQMNPYAGQGFDGMKNGTATSGTYATPGGIQGQPSDGSGDFGSLLRNFTGADLQNEPGYQFGVSQGEQGINRAASGRGSYDSGATLKALTRFNQDYAGTKYDAAFNRDAANKSRTYGFLSGQSGQGVNAAGQTAGLGANAANAAGGYVTNAGDAGAAGSIGGANAIGGGVSSYLNYQNNQDILNYLRNSGTFGRGGNAQYGPSNQG